jgi:hypothetical protein
LQSEERCDLYMPPDFIRVIKQKEEWDGEGGCDAHVGEENLVRKP